MESSGQPVRVMRTALEDGRRQASRIAVDGVAEVDMSAVLDRPESRGALCRELAQSQLSAGQVEAAVQSFVRALQADPAEREHATRLRVALLELGHTALAEPLVVALKAASDQMYQRNVQRLRLSPYVDYPQHVHLETLAKCNARCSFCPSPTLARTGAKLDDAVISKVLADLQDIPSNLSFQLSPFKVNEPFLDVRLFDILDDIQARLPNASLALTSNASPLTAKKLARLATISALRTLYVSFNDHRPDAYEAVMGIPFQRTCDRLDMLHRALTHGELSLRVVLSRVGDGSPDDDAFRQAVLRRWPAFDTLVLRRGNWLGQVDTPIASVPDIGCVRWFELSITATGTVAHCCMDGEAKWPLGDVRHQHVLEVYNQPEFRALRVRATSRHDAEPCNRCTFL